MCGRYSWWSQEILREFFAIQHSHYSVGRKLQMSPNEQCESIELLRAIENDMRVFSLKMMGDSFSVDVQDDLLKARVAMKSDKYFGNY